MEMIEMAFLDTNSYNLKKWHHFLEKSGHPIRKIIKMIDRKR